MADLIWLRQWFEIHAIELAAAGIKYSCVVERTETDNPASTFCLDADHWLANVSLWESGSCDFEAYITSTMPERPFNLCRNTESEKDLDEVLSQVFTL